MPGIAVCLDAPPHGVKVSGKNRKGSLKIEQIYIYYL